MNSVATPSGAALQRHSAGLVTRLVADVLDGAVLLSAAGLVLLFAAVIAFLARPDRFSVPPLPPWVVPLVLGALTFVYFGYGWSGPARTLGKLLVGLRVVDRAGNPLSPQHALVRVLAYVVFPAGLLWCLVSRRNASVQDLLLRTAVVYDWPAVRA